MASLKGRMWLSKAHSIYKDLLVRADGLFSEEKLSLHNEYLSCLRKAAYAGNTEAQYELAMEYEDMNFFLLNPNYNPNKMFYWYSKAAQANHPDALNRLATLYEAGLGCVKNINLAVKLYRQSAELGSRSGKSNYKLMLKQMAKGS